MDWHTYRCIRHLHSDLILSPGRMNGLMVSVAIEVRKSSACLYGLLRYFAEDGLHNKAGKTKRLWGCSIPVVVMGTMQ